VAEIVLLALLFLLAAILYSSVGHAGATAYLAAMALVGIAPETMRPTALVLNLFVASLVTLRFLEERPEDAGEWLEPDERTALTGRMAHDQQLKAELHSGDLRGAVRSGQVWLLSLIYFILLAAGFGLTFFVPDLVEDRTGYSDFDRFIESLRELLSADLPEVVNPYDSLYDELGFDSFQAFELLAQAPLFLSLCLATVGAALAPLA
jgi:hypothetical protein